MDDETGYRVLEQRHETFQVEAKYVGMSNDGERVLLKKRSNGKTIEVPLELLSEADRNYVAETRAEEE